MTLTLGEVLRQHTMLTIVDVGEQRSGLSSSRRREKVIGEDYRVGDRFHIKEHRLFQESRPNAALYEGILFKHHIRLLLSPARKFGIQAAEGRERQFDS